MSTTLGMMMALLALAYSRPILAEDSRTVVAWLYQRDWDLAVESLHRHKDLIREVSPAWYMLSPAGVVIPIPGAFIDDTQVREIARSSSMLLRPLVGTANTKAEWVMPRLRDEVWRKRHVGELTQLALLRGYDGIDLDYEGIRMPELEVYAAFIEELAASLHVADKTLAVSLEVQGSDDVIPVWTRIGRVVDSVRIMTYGSKSATPGPLMELGQMRLHLERAIKAIPKQKLVHGIALYGLDWSPRVGSGTWAEYERRARVAGTLPLLEPVSKMSRYKDAKGTVQYENAESIAEKMRIARTLGIRKFAFWRLGGEDPQVWDTVSRLE